MKQKKINHASGSTQSQDTIAVGAVVNEAGMAINNNTKTMASMFIQNQSTTTILLIAVVGIAAYMFYLNSKKK